ncbi:putative exported phospholipase, patatin-like protein [Paraburkholderia piptadeniae]|uniref:Exported phospholipase, patatin-like protein n=1 Tax=Paraburkholderia piptadeniae TaxID=1701573 RepID=A0A1N7S8A2_9BURK|nr:patatin-like phospholipase family protein [Paraburkholderia piptadeniae]SIT43635.1 putative exported phospholipase, patatin-like protein [Paraburkholderia piptadeniae]
MKKRIRVALSGSGFRLGAHLGALQAIVDAGYEIIELAGTSGGSIVAAMYAGGMRLGDMHDLCMRMDWSPMMRFSPWAVLRHQALCSGTALEAFLRDGSKGKTFADLELDLKIIAADLLTEKEFQFSRETTPKVPIGMAARASASIPIVFPPVDVAGALLVDGGTADNVPVSDLTVDEVPRLGIYLVSDDAPLRPGRYGLRTLAPRIIDLMLAANETAHVDLDQRSGATIARIPTGYASSFDRNMPLATRRRLYEDGYTNTQLALSSL